MTLLMIWREYGVDRAWMVSDSRLSHPGHANGRVQITDRAAKVLEAEVALYRLNAPPVPILSTKLGFAFTGSTLIALQAYTAVLPLWSRLQTSGEEVLPTVEQCAKHLSLFVTGYATDVASSGGIADCQCVLIGYNNATASVDGWLIETRRTDHGLSSQMRSLVLAENMEILGSGAPIALKWARDLRTENQAWRRQPLWLIRQYLKSNPQDDVGGGVQIGMTTSAGFELHYDAQPFAAGISAAGDPLVAMTYRGFDMFDISRVGDAFVTLTGLQG